MNYEKLDVNTTKSKWST